MIAFTHAARLRSRNMTAQSMRLRRSRARSARWRNSYANFKKLVSKNSRSIKAAALCLALGLVLGAIAAVVLPGFVVPSGATTASSNSGLQQVPAPLATQILECTPEDITPISTPVAASGDETFPGLKLSTDLSLTTLFEGNKP